MRPTPKEPERVPWVRYEAGASLLDLLRVSRETELAHRRLCDYHWQSGLWPAADGADAGVLCRAGQGEWPQTLAELARLGWVECKGRLYHSGVHRVRVNAVAALHAKRDSGRLGAEQRWGGRPARAGAPSPGGSPNDTANGSANDTANDTAHDTAHDTANGTANGTATVPPMQSKSKSKSKSESKSTEKTFNAFNDERLTLFQSPS